MYLYGIEIKKAASDVSDSRVLIVPLWNWNSHSCRRKNGKIYVLIVPLWNWNEKWILHAPWLDWVLIVPLWNWNSSFHPFFSRISGSNCTFMELKYMFGMKLDTANKVLIVPLWNWNMNKIDAAFYRLGSSNCTFMELKYESMWLHSMRI